MIRKYHKWTEWECYKAGFYDDKPVNEKTKEQAMKEYAEFLSDLPRFRKGMERVAKEWINSCEHFLTNENINRIAWLGQSAMCIETGISSFFRGGFYLLSEEQQKQANKEAEKFLLEWVLNYEKSQSVHKTVGETRLF